jgi:hypothetical protein
MIEAEASCRSSGYILAKKRVSERERERDHIRKRNPNLTAAVRKISTVEEKKDSCHD